ncbi:hypothetical protein [Nocardioides antri]|nr:hypothetical protein [Nocardioides antri]
MDETEPVFMDIRLWDQSALVLLDCLLETDESSLTYSHPAQKRRCAT